MKNSKHNYAIVLAGGEGSRFWPLSRSLEPKQFLSLHTANSLFQDTLSRIKKIIPPQHIFIVTNQLFFPEIFNYTCGFKIPESNIIFEPEGKNTAPSIAIACHLINRIDPEARVLVLPSDHLISNQDKFNRLLRFVFSFRETGRVMNSRGLRDNLIIFGILPDYAATGYGYIKIRAKNSELRAKKIYPVEKFVEKPDIKKAKIFFKDKRYFWNSGMFFGYVDIFLSEFKNNIPSLYKAILRIKKPQDINRVWKRIKPVSFDYGILEKTKNVLMISVNNLGWSDLGTWASWDKTLPKDKLKNSINADAIISKSKNITVFGKSRLIACLGLEDLIIVDTPDALLITRKDKSEAVKDVVSLLKKGNRQERYLHRTVKRPWGKYTVLDKGSGFKIKLIEVLPKKAISLQKHFHRSEHWVVVAGRARITKDKTVYYIDANESTFIPKRYIHRLENPVNFPLKIVEVQSGDYLEEDDIVRLKDEFGRT